MKLAVGTYLYGGKYQIEKVLGQGSFGITYLAKARFSTSGSLGDMDVVADVAIKEFFMSDINGRKKDGTTVEGSTGSVFTNYRHRFRKEAENLARLSHPNIVKVFDIFEENGTAYYVMEYLGDKSLDNYIKHKGRLTEEECIFLTKTIGGALSHMHKSRMLHLDLKPGNIMMHNGEPVLIDFGLSKQYDSSGQPETSTTIGLGTSGYAPLEQQNYNGNMTAGLPCGMDVYALGATMFKMLTGNTPPDAYSILNDGFPNNDFKELSISEGLVSVVRKAMAPRKSNRFRSVDEFVARLGRSVTVDVDPDHPTASESVAGEKKGNKNVKPGTAGAEGKSGAKGKADSIDLRSFWVVVHLALVGITLMTFLTEHVYRGRVEFPTGIYPNTFLQMVSQAIESNDNVGAAVGAVVAMVAGLLLLLMIVWDRKARTFITFCGAALILLASWLCAFSGSCRYDNMAWIIFLVLSLASSWCISECTPKKRNRK